MTKRALIAALVGSVAMYLWSSLAHVVLPLGAIGISVIPNEQALLANLHATLGEASGFYMFPDFGGSPDMQQYGQKLAVNPSGMIIYHPPGAKPMTPGQLITEFLVELAETLLAVFLLAQTGLKTFGARAGFIITAGLLASLGTNVSYWNWYGFPSSYTLAYMCIQLFGFVVAGLIVAALMKNRALRG